MKTEFEIRVDERARCAGMLKFRGFDQAANIIRSDLRCDVSDPIAEARAQAFEEAAKCAAEMSSWHQHWCNKTSGSSRAIHEAKAGALAELSGTLNNKAAAIHAAGRQR